MTAAGDAGPGAVERDPNRPTLHPTFVQRALDTEAEAWAIETDIVDGWLARMSTDPRTVAKLRQIAVLAFTEGLYRGACNVFDGTPLAVTVEGVATDRNRLAAELAAARAEVEARERRIAVLEEALAPFAQAGESALKTGWSDNAGMGNGLVMGDFRRTARTRGGSDAG